MDATRQQERVTELLGLSPVSVIDDVINSANDYMYAAVDEFRKHLAERGRLAPEELDAVRFAAYLEFH